MDDAQPGLEETIAIKRLKKGDLKGLEILVKRYQVQAVHAVYLILRDRALAEDIAQGAFLRAVEKIDQFDENRSFAPWFFRMLINDAFKAANRQKRQVSWDDDEVDNGAFSFRDHPCLSPEEIAMADETGQVVWQALDRLSVQQRAAIVMRHFLEMSDVEMTAALKRPPSTVHWWLRAARERLRDLLRPFWQAERPGSDDGKPGKS